MIENNRLYQELISDSPTIITPITGSESPESLIEIAEKADVVEFRIDHFEDPLTSHGAVRDPLISALPSIATIRTISQGGAWLAECYRGEEKRAETFRSLIGSVDGLDIEIDSSDSKEIMDVMSEADEEGKVLIGSYHDFKTTPQEEELNELVGLGVNAGFNFIKLATTINDFEDFIRLREFTARQKGAGVIVVGMSTDIKPSSMGNERQYSLAAISRFSLLDFGSAATYASCGRLWVPGQQSLADARMIIDSIYAPQE